MTVIRKGRNVEIHFDDAGGTNRDMTAYWQSGDPDVSDDQVEVTTFADSAHRNNPGLESAGLSFTFDQYSTGTASPWVVFTGLMASNGTVHDIMYYPDGTASGQPIVTVPAKCVRIAPGGGVGERGVMTVDFAVDGTRTIGTV